MKEIVKKEVSRKTGNTRITYSDGTVEIIKASASPAVATKGFATKPSKKGLAKITEQVKFEVPEIGQPTIEEENIIIPGSTRKEVDPLKVVPSDVRPDVDVTSQLAGGTVAPNQFGKSIDNYYANKAVTDSQSKYGLGDAIGMGASVLQAGYGLQQLMKDKRPIDKLDPAYDQLTNEAIAASKYGYSPAQRALLEQQITQGRIGQQAQINQLAGGNAAVGLTNSRAAINKEMMNRLQLASEDERLRMQKAQVAGQMAGSRAGMSRQLFADNMAAFQQKQQSGADLLGAGLQNIVGAARYRQEKMAQDQINKLMFGSGNIV
jgi:hypothetical protein